MTSTSLEFVDGYISDESEFVGRVSLSHPIAYVVTRLRKHRNKTSMGAEGRTDNR